MPRATVARSSYVRIPVKLGAEICESPTKYWNFSLKSRIFRIANGINYLRSTFRIGTLSIKASDDLSKRDIFEAYTCLNRTTPDEKSTAA